MTFLVPDSWSPQQALAVFELLDDLREVIATRYGTDLQSALHEQRESCRDPRQSNELALRTGRPRLLNNTDHDQDKGACRPPCSISQHAGSAAAQGAPVVCVQARRVAPLQRTQLAAA